MVHAEEIFPAGCKPFVTQDAQVSIPKGKSGIIMVHNLTDGDLWVTRPISDPNSSPTWSSLLHAGSWSALAWQGEEFKLSCIESRPGHEQQVSCADALALCQWSKAKLPAQLTTSMWAGENMSLSALMAYIQRRGFELPVKTT